MTLSLLHHCSRSRDMGFAEEVTNGQELGNEMMRLVQMPSHFPGTRCGEEDLAVLFEVMLKGKKAHRNASELCSKSPFP